jgi:hypothetical protein
MSRRRRNRTGQPETVSIPDLGAAARAGAAAAESHKAVEPGDRKRIWKKVRDAVAAAEEALPGPKRGPERKAWVVAFLNTLIDLKGRNEEEEAKLFGTLIDLAVFLYNVGVYAWPIIRAAT